MECYYTNGFVAVHEGEDMPDMFREYEKPDVLMVRATERDGTVAVVAKVAQLTDELLLLYFNTDDLVVAKQKQEKQLALMRAASSALDVHLLREKDGATLQ